MVKPSSPILPPGSPTDSLSLMSSSSSNSQSSDSSPSTTASSAPSKQSNIVPDEEINSVGDDNDDVVELSSDSESESPEDDLETISELKQMQQEIQQIQSQFQLKLGKLENRVNKRRRLPVLGHQNGQPLHSTSVSTLSVDKETGFKRKLEIVTEELSRSRMEQAKKLRKNVPKEQMVIEIPDFPLENYDISATYALYHEGGNSWFDHFNRNKEVLKFGSYYNWITERTNNFLPEVLKIIQKTQTRNQLKKIDLLACRQVCKSWKLILDKYLEDQVSYLGTRKCGGVLTSVATKLSSDHLDKFAEIESYTTLHDCMGNHPFPSHHLRVDLRQDDDWKPVWNFKNKFSSFLDKFGQQVFYLSLLFSCKEDTSLLFISTVNGPGISWPTLQSWLVKMPNLRGVKFVFSPSTAVKDKWRLAHEIRVMAQLPFPQLSKLEFIECDFVPSVLVDSIIFNNNQIKKVALFETYNKNIIPWPSKNFKFDLLVNLTHLNVNIFKSSQLNALSAGYVPLRNLHLSNIGQMLDSEGWNLQEIFLAVENFGKTLEQLGLQLRIKVPVNELRLKLPKLKHLELCFQKNYADQISYDFILPLNSLECLKINFNWELKANEIIRVNGFNNSNGNTFSSAVENVEEIIQLKGYQDRLYSSNIWGLLPCLKKVNIEDRKRDENPAQTHKYSRAPSS